MPFQTKRPGAKGLGWDGMEGTGRALPSARRGRTAAGADGDGDGDGVGKLRLDGVGVPWGHHWGGENRVWGRTWGKRVERAVTVVEVTVMGLGVCFLLSAVCFLDRRQGRW